MLKKIAISEGGQGIMKVMSKPYKSFEETATLKRLDKLIDQGEKFHAVRSHPGRTRETEDWRDEVTGMTSSIWGTECHYYKKMRETLLFHK